MTASAGLMSRPVPLPNSFVVPEQKVVYIQVAKAACTSLRWMIADLAGENLSRFKRVTGAHQTSLMTVHAPRKLWRNALAVADTDPEIIEQISPENGWFIFGVVRDPWSRLWSAWQSKFLVRHVPYIDWYRNAPWFPRVPTSAEDILEDWRLFVDQAPWLTEPLLAQDQHFRSQVAALHPDVINFSRIYDLTDMATLQADLGRHLEAVGRPHRLFLPRANETAVRLTASALDQGISERITDLYEADFERFGSRWRLDDLRLDRVISPEAVATVGFQIASNQRIADMAREADQLRVDLDRARRSAVAAMAQAKKADARAEKANARIEKAAARTERATARAQRAEDRVATLQAQQTRPALPIWRRIARRARRLLTSSSAR